MGGLSFPRKPWAYGDRVFDPVYRYSCLHKLFSGPLVLLVGTPRIWFRILLYHVQYSGELIRSFGTTLEPRYIFGADSLDQ
jgi:hypothetical protein